MYRDRDDEIDETEEISFEDTQEFDEPGFEEGPDEDEPEFEDDDEDFPDEDEYSEDEPDIVDLETEEAELPGDNGEEEPQDSVSVHLKAAGAAAVARVRRISPPKVPTPSVSKPANGSVLGVVAIVIAALAVGVGAFFLGKGTGDDVDTARLEGDAAGRQAGAIEGAAAGYAAGFQKGRDAGFSKAYVPAYKLNYKRAFEQAGLDAPTSDEIDVPKP